MAKFQDKSHRSKSKTQGNFLCCFGFFKKVGQFKTVKQGHDHKRKRLFSWIKFSARKPPSLVSKTTTTFPIERNMSKANFDHIAVRSSIAPTTTYKASNEDPVVEDVPKVTHLTVKKRLELAKNDNDEEKTILKNCKNPVLPKKPTGPTRFSINRKIESIRSGQFVQPVSSTMKKPESTHPNPALSHSLSFPPSNPVRMNRVEDPLIMMPVGFNNVGGTNRDMGKKYGWMVGMSILIITLMIMLLWGKLCAILCTAAWFYITVSFKSIFEESDEIELFKLRESGTYLGGV